jgi:putative acetyltransferase
MNVRLYQPHDAAAVAHVFTESVHSSGAADYSPEQLLAWAPKPADIEHWRRKLSKLICFVAEIDSRIVGFVTFEPNGHLDHLYVHSRFQRQGVASALYRRLENEARPRAIHRIFAEASITARPFFERAGFRLIAAQEVKHGAISFINYRMERLLS